jgi:hypothetical protein
MEAWRSGSIASPFSASVLFGDERSVSPTAASLLRIDSKVHIEGWVGVPGNYLDALKVGRTFFCVCRKSNLDSVVAQLVTLSLYLPSDV